MEQVQEKTTTRNYRDLIVWQNTIKSAKLIYKLTEHFPKQETYTLADQIRRAAISAPSNIAEGQARRASAEFRRFIHIALGSLAGVDTQLVLAQEFGYLGRDDIDSVDGHIRDLRKKNSTRS